MILESQWSWVFGMFITFVTFVVMLLKKIKFVKCAAVAISMFSITYFISTLLFPLTFLSDVRGPAQTVFRSIIPFVNLIRSKWTVTLSDNTVQYDYFYMNLLVKHFILDLTVTSVLGATFRIFGNNNVGSIVRSSVTVAFLMIIKAVLFMLNISRSSIFDSIELLVIVIGAAIGSFSMHFIAGYKNNKELSENE